MPRGRPRSKRPKRTAWTYTEDHPCARGCGTTLPPGTGAWCRQCQRDYQREYQRTRRRGRAFEDLTTAVFSKPPPPPPGFALSDMRTAAPYGSAHVPESAWADGARPGGFDAAKGGWNVELA